MPHAGQGGEGLRRHERINGDLAYSIYKALVCLSTSVYDHAAGRVGLACLDGEATCFSFVVRTRA